MMMNSSTDNASTLQPYPLEEFKETSASVLEKAQIVFQMRPAAMHGRIIASVASSFYCAKRDTKIHDLAEWLVNNPSVKALGVVDDNGYAGGVIVATELFNILSTKFGRELHFGKTVDTIVRRAGTFNYTENILSIASEISPSLMNPEPTYFLLTDQSGRFAGIFSTHDVLVYLSDITKKDIKLASRIQGCVVPKEKLHEEESFRFIAQVKMAKEIGGDFYTLRRYEQQKWFFALCDVSGKGMSAALMSVAIGGMVHLYNFNQGIKSFVTSLNEYFYRTFEGEQFVTGVFLDFDASSGKVEICDAGHSMLYLLRGGQIRRFRTKEDNPPLGIRHDFPSNTGCAYLKQGDMIIVCSDGIEDQKNSAGERYSIERFLRLMNNKRKSDFAEMLQSVFSDINEFRQNQPQDDDISIILFEYLGLKVTPKDQTEQI